MNKIIDQRMEEARGTMREYEAAACALAQAVCDWVKAEKGWESKWHLGDYEAGIDTITIELDCCCFDEACDFEIKLMKAFDDCNQRSPDFNVRCSNNKYDCAIHSKKVVIEPGQ